MLFPPLPGWDGLHPLVLHFPLAILLVAPLFLVLGIVTRERGRCWVHCAFLLSALGTISAWIAVSTGEAAGELVTRTPEINAALERHEGLAELVRNYFTIVTLVFAAVLFLPRLLKRPLAPRRSWIALIVLLGAYGVGALALTHTGDAGGRLVHELGVRGMVPPSTGRSIFLGKEKPADAEEPGDGGTEE